MYYLKMLATAGALSCVLLLGGCNSDGSVNWNTVGAVSLGIGAATLGAAEAYSAANRPVYYYNPPVVVVCRPYWSC